MMSDTRPSAANPASDSQLIPHAVRALRGKFPAVETEMLHSAIMSAWAYKLKKSGIRDVQAFIIGTAFYRVLDRLRGSAREVGVDNVDRFHSRQPDLDALLDLESTALAMQEQFKTPRRKKLFTLLIAKHSDERLLTYEDIAEEVRCSSTYVKRVWREIQSHFIGRV
jgi:DNA-directed RNA polymerase specialized sigma24 family protein